MTGNVAIHREAETIVRAKANATAHCQTVQVQPFACDATQKKKRLNAGSPLNAGAPFSEGPGHGPICGATPLIARGLVAIARAKVRIPRSSTAVGMGGGTCQD